jgi:superfamily II DNA or RNA helicase
MNCILKINNDYSYLITSDQILKKKLHDALRYKQKDYYHTRAYQSKKWDGYINFFTKTNGRFLTGLLPEVTLALKYFKVPYEIHDERKIVDFAYDSIDENFLNKWLPKDELPITLFDYQVDLVNKAIKNKRGIVMSPTASGKTQIMLSIMKALPPNTPIIFLVNRKGLVTQNYKEMIKWGFANVGRFNSDYHEPNIITCANVQSLHHLDNIIHKFQAVIADEIHTLSNNTGISAFRKLKGAGVRIAVSATPFKSDGKDKVQKFTVKGYFGAILETSITESGVLTTSFLQKRGNLSDSDCTFFTIKEPQLPYDIYIDAVTNGIANNWEFHNIVSRLAMSLKGRTLIMVARIAHGDALHRLIPNSLWIYGKDDEATRQIVIDKLKSAKENTIAIATEGIFSIGVNFFVHNFINCSGGQAYHDVVQKMGRGLRTANDKEILKYYDFMFKINPYLEKHSKARVKILTKEGHKVVVKEALDF